MMVRPRVTDDDGFVTDEYEEWEAEHVGREDALGWWDGTWPTDDEPPADEGK